MPDRARGRRRCAPADRRSPLLEGDWIVMYRSQMTRRKETPSHLDRITRGNCDHRSPSSGCCCRPCKKLREAAARMVLLQQSQTTRSGDSQSTNRLTASCPAAYQPAENRRHRPQRRLRRQAGWAVAAGEFFCRLWSRMPCIRN